MCEGLLLYVQCACVHLFMCRYMFTWPWSVWVSVCLLVSLCGHGLEGTLLPCALSVLFSGLPPFPSSEDQLVVG